jgi:hypothetical protein
MPVKPKLSATLRRMPALHLVMGRAHSIRPATADVGEDVPDIVFAQPVCESGHVTLITLWGVWWDETVPGDRKQHLERVVPRMTGVVVRRRRKSPAGEAVAPVRLAFEFLAMAGGAVRFVDDAAGIDAFGCG